MKKTKERRKKLSAKKWAKEYKSGGGSFAIRLPEGVEMFKLEKAGVRRILIIPYTVGKGNPYADEGETHFERTYFSHPRIGPSNETFVCASETYKKKCAVCEYAAELRQDPDTKKDVVDALRPKQRQLWNVVDLDEPEKGVQLWEIAQFSFGKLLRERCTNEDEDEDFSSFADPEEGKILKLTISEESYKGRPTYKVAAIDFKDMKKPMSEEWLEAAVCLDDLLIKAKYDEVKKVLEGGDDEDDEDDEDNEPKRKKKSRRSEDDEDDEEPVRSKKKSRRVEEDDEDDDEDEAPKKRKRSR